MPEKVKEPAASGTAKSEAPRQRRGTDGTKFFTPCQVAERWGWHVESVRRAMRERRLQSTIISRRRLMLVAEVERVEAEGHIARVA